MNDVSPLRVQRLRAERRNDGAPVATSTPRLSWITEAGASDWMQASAEIERDGQVTRIDGDASVFVPWPFAPLAPREEAVVRVRVTGSDGSTSDWSEPLTITAGHLAEVSGGRFRLGLGVSHGPAMDRLGVQTGKPLSDIRTYVESLRAAERPAGPLPPIYLAALRDKMLALAVEIADGAIWANASFSHMETQLATIPAHERDSFALYDMAPTVIDADKDAARAIHRRTLTGYVTLPNYRNYWKAAGYADEMAAIEDAIAAGDRDKLPSLMSDEWVDDCTISGSPGEVRERLEAWYELGVTPIAVMSSTSGGQAHAIGQLFELYE